MKHTLISKEKNQYIANLHCHTTLSDGRKSPEEIRDAYMEQGYSIVAFSDHDNYFDHSDFCTDDFVAINSVCLRPSEIYQCHRRLAHSQRPHPAGPENASAGQQ